MEDSALNLLKREFELWGVKFHHHNLNSGHIKLEWQATPDKPGRYYIIPKTAGDHRGWLNARSKIRLLFKADGLKAKEQITKPKPALKAALALPAAVEKDSDQIKLLRAEVGDLTDIILELATTVIDLRKQVEGLALVPAPVAEPVPVKFTAVLSEKQTRRAIKAYDHLSYNWNSTEVLAREMGMPTEIAYRRLYALTRGENPKVEMQRGLWRKKREHAAIQAAVEKDQRLNGKHH